MHDYGFGLSPRVRGSRDNALIHVPQPGSIPACAGEPNTRVPSKVAGAVYPRVCGGARKIDIDPEYRAGLSPRVRGSPY